MNDAIAPPTYRARFLATMESLMGKPVLWAQKGPDSFDCSGSVTWCLKQVGGPDLRLTHNAQSLHDATRALGPGDLLIPGDLVFYGATGPKDVEHVAVYDEYAGVVSADGATSHITSLSVAMANPANRVRRHATIKYRSDTRYIVVHRNTLVDQLDGITR